MDRPSNDVPRPVTRVARPRDAHRPGYEITVRSFLDPKFSYVVRYELEDTFPQIYHFHPHLANKKICELNGAGSGGHPALWIGWPTGSRWAWRQRPTSVQPAMGDGAGNPLRLDPCSQPDVELEIDAIHLGK
jgi:hypothetical protein